MSEHCLYCHNHIPFQLSWTTLTRQPKPQYLCRECQKKLTYIKGATCEICSRPLEKLAKEFYQKNTCLDCIRWEEDAYWNGILEKNISLYDYNDFLKDLLARYKFRGDYCLAKVFTTDLQKALQPLHYDYLVPIPLSDERLHERGFNQAKALAVEANLEIKEILTRTHSEKQSKKSRHERIHIDQVFQVSDPAIIKEKQILLMDDIYTTGSTLRHAAKTFINAGAKNVSSITIARG